jgi:hypothetical protein
MPISLAIFAAFEPLDGPNPRLTVYERNLVLCCRAWEALLYPSTNIKPAMAPNPGPPDVGPARSHFSLDNLRGLNRLKTYIVSPLR